MRCRTIRALWLSAVCCLPCAHTVWSETVGVLILAHGGSPRWNRTVRQTVAAAHLDSPTRIVFGMGMHAEEVRRLQRAIEELEQRGVRRLIAVPLLISSASEVMRQFQYLLGARDHGPWEEVKPVNLRVPVTLTTPLDDDPAVSAILLDRARQLSRAPGGKAVILIAHGPTSEEDDARWLEVMGRIARQLEDAGGFRAVVPVTMRDDAPEAVRDAATKRMREVVEREARQGADVVLVVPLLLATGGIEAKIPHRLSGLAYRYQPQALLPDVRVAQWITRQVRQAAASPAS